MAQPTRGQVWRKVLLKDPCAYCGRASETIDHVIPHCDGGSNGEANLVGACGRCNRRKGMRTVLQMLTGLPATQDVSLSLVHPRQRDRYLDEIKAVRARRASVERLRTAAYYTSLYRAGVFPKSGSLLILLDIPTGRR